MKKILPLLFGCAVLMVAAVRVEAKWWIFGQSADDVNLKYLYLNEVSFDEGGPALCLPQDSLTNGMIVIKGKAEAGKAKIGTVQVTTDKKETWTKAKLSSDGTFEYTFKPEIDTPYDIYVKVTDTRGKSNDVDRTYKQLKVMVIDSQAAAHDAMDGMIRAYSSENLSQFMAYISEDFAADKSILDRAVMHDFSAFKNIELRYTFNNVTNDPHGGISVSITFTRTVTSALTGQLFSDGGMTEFVFKLEGDGYKVYSMKMPLIFGLSDAANVATGVVNSAANNIANAISVDAGGNIGTGPIAGGLGGGAAMGSASAGAQITMTYNNTTNFMSWWFNSFTFSNGAITKDSWGVAAISGDFAIFGDDHHLNTGPGVGYLDLGVASLTAVTTVPSSWSSYSMAFGESADVEKGHVYIFKLADGTSYGAIQIINATVPVTTLRYKYSASGPTFK